jgi:hypothetical protein
MRTSASHRALTCTVVLWGSLALSGSSADAQVSDKASSTTTVGRPTGITLDFSGGCAYKEDGIPGVASITDLAALYDSGGDANWKTLQGLLRQIVGTCETYLDATPAGTPEKKYIVEKSLAKMSQGTLIVTFIAGTTSYYVVVPAELPYSTVLTGEQHVVPVFLVDSTAHSNATKAPTDVKFMSTQGTDPRMAQGPAFLKAVAAVVNPAKLVGFDVIVNYVTPKTEPKIWAYGVTVTADLPYKSGTIQESGTIPLVCQARKNKDETESAILPPCSAAGDTLASVKIAQPYVNKPKLHWEFAATAGAVVGPYYGKHPGMKVDNGKYASSPVSHATTMAAIAWHPEAYDSSLPSMSWPERLGLFVGAVITPGAGIGAGVSIGLVRGFGLNIGEMATWNPTSVNGDSPGATVPTGSAQLAHRPSYGTFIGGTYAFGGGGG